MKTPTDRLSEFDEQFTEIVQVRPKILKQLDPKIKHHLIQTIISVLQEQVAVVEGMLIKPQEIEEKHQEQFATDERAYRLNSSKLNMEKMKLHEGSTAQYLGGRNQGYIQALSDYKHSLEETIKLWEKLIN